MNKKSEKSKNHATAEGVSSSKLLGCRNILDKLWLKVKNMRGYDLEWEWMSETKDGKYLKREQLLNLINKIKKEKAG